MIVTEKAAAEMWCPAARVALEWSQDIGGLNGGKQSIGVTVNRGKHSSEAPNCIGSKCMWWVWAEAPSLTLHVYLDEDRHRETERVVPFQMDGRWWRYRLTGNDHEGEYDEFVSQITDEKYGHCGQAGKP